MVDRTVIIAGLNETQVKKVVVGAPIRSIVQSSGSIANLSDVDVSGASHGNLLAYDSSVGKWEASDALPPVNVTAGTYGSATKRIQIKILSDGRLDSAGEVDILSPVNVTVGTYGSATKIPQIKILSDGRLDSAGEISVATNIALAGDSGTDSVSILADTLTFSGGNGLRTVVTNNNVAINIDDTLSLANLTITGGLTVTGTQTVINSETLNVADHHIKLNSNDSAGSPNASIDIGYAAGRKEDSSGFAFTGMFRDATDKTFKVYDNYTLDPTGSTAINIAHSSFSLAPFKASTLAGSYLGFDSDVGAKITAADASIGFDLDSSSGQFKINVFNASYTQRGLAFFDNTQFTVVNGGVTLNIVDGGEY